MEIAEAVGLVLGVMLYIALMVLSGFFIFWTARILSRLPSYMERITVAFETIAKKLGER